MRPVVRNYVETVFRSLPLHGPVYEFGAMEIDTPSLKGVTNFRQLAAGYGLPYVGCDMRAGPGVDSVQDLHGLDLPDAIAGTVISTDTLEHVEYPRKAMQEVYRILQDPGILIVTTVMNFPIHGVPDDFWRFTPSGLRSVLQPFDEVIVDYCGKEDFPRTVVAVAFKGASPDVSSLKENLAVWRDKENHRIQKIEEKYREQGLI
ncbi:MAG: methyltransferase domain-containing protein [Gammaproteobacteria bacterium]|nr:MAG: methyltransferase domain-containing protein [Gammaproteobacteria bacterium]